MGSIKQRVFVQHFLGLLVITIAFSPAMAGEKHTVLVIESYHAEYPWDISWKVGLEEVLGEKVTFFNFQMDTKRRSASEFESRAREAFAEYERVKPDLVFLGDDVALKLLAARFGKTETPVVYLGINDTPRAYGIHQFKNITGVLERPLLKSTIPLIKNIFKGNVRKILILLDQDTTSRIIFKEVFDEQFTLSVQGVALDLVLVRDWGKWQDLVTNAKNNGYDALIVGLYHTIFDDKGQYVDAEFVIRWTSEHTPIPPFAFWDFAVASDKAMGGIVLYGNEQGKLAGQLALRILNGAKPEHILPVVAERGRYLFSETQLKKWGLVPYPPIVLQRAELIP